jgi:lamin tail-like protein
MTGLFGAAAIAPDAAAAASCVRISGGVFNAPGNDNLAALLNGEFIRIKNYCATAKVLTGWRLHDYGRKHTYYFRTGFRIGAGVTVTIFSGRGTNTAARLYWQRAYGAVWNNTPPERAYLRNSAGVLQSQWSLY